MDGLGQGERRDLHGRELDLGAVLREALEGVNPGGGGRHGGGAEDEERGELRGGHAPSERTAAGVDFRWIEFPRVIADARCVGWIDDYFGVRRAGSSLRTELRAGITTFLTMAYILFVNPSILGKAIPIEGAGPQLLTATALAAAVGSLLMGLLARYPFALAPGMGINAYFTYTVVLGQGVPWPTALGATFVSGLFFLAISLTGLRAWLVDAIPAPLKIGTAAGIGLFLALIGLENAGLVVDHPATLVTLGDLGGASARLGVFGVLLIGVLLARRVRGAILLGIAVTSALAILTRAPVFGGAPFPGFAEGVVRPPVWPTELFFALDLRGAFELGLLGIVFVFLFVDFFDTAGTLIGLSEKAGFTDAEGRLPRASQAFTADAIATSVGALFGTSTTTTYIESASGIEEGGRTGLVAVIVAACFLLSLFFWPLAGAVPPVATAPALIVVGAMMMSNLGRVDWTDPAVAVPCFVTLVGMPLSYSIANGISFGIIAHTAIGALAGRRPHPVMYALSALLVARYAWLAGG